MTNDFNNTENENRFHLYEHKSNDYILDNPNTSLDFIEMLGDALTFEEIVDLLNSLNNENTHIKQTIQDMINTERTAIGKSVLKQLWEAIQ